MIFSIAQLTSDQLHSIRDFEKQCGHCIVALRGLPGEPAELCDDDIARLRDVEQKLGLTLVAVE
jgi:hypothetical protein